MHVHMNIHAVMEHSGKLYRHPTLLVLYAIPTRLLFNDSAQPLIHKLNHGDNPMADKM